MDQKVVKEELKKLESNEKTVILSDFFEKQEEDGNELSRMLLDIIHEAFTTGFEVAIESVISSIDEKSIE